MRARARTFAKARGADEGARRFRARGAGGGDGRYTAHSEQEDSSSSSGEADIRLSFYRSRSGYSGDTLEERARASTLKKSVTCRPGENLLAAAERAEGVVLVTPDLCLSGSCGKCEMVLSFSTDDRAETSVVRACETVVPTEEPELFVEVLPLIADEDGWARLEENVAASLPSEWTTSDDGDDFEFV